MIITAQKKTNLQPFFWYFQQSKSIVILGNIKSELQEFCNEIKKLLQYW